MIKLPSWIVVLFVLLKSGCVSEPGVLSGVESEQIVEQITAMHDSLKSAWEHGSAVALGRYQLESGIITYDRTRFSGQDFLEWADRVGTEGRKQRVGPFNNLRVDVLSRESAVSTWDFTFAFLDSLGTPGEEMVGLMTQVWVREANDWKILHVHETTYESAESQ